MPERQADSLQLISLLLQYPDEELLGGLDELASIAERACPGEIGPAIVAFLEDLGRQSLIGAQERYTGVFDLNPSTTLNLSYHVHGDTEKRAAELARLQRHYDEAGWERIGGELPDYLPMMLEFLAICPNPKHAEPVWKCLQAMPALIEGLERRAPAYASLLQPIAHMALTYGSSAETKDLTLGSKA